MRIDEVSSLLEKLGVEVKAYLEVLDKHKVSDSLVLEWHQLRKGRDRKKTFMQEVWQQRHFTAVKLYQLLAAYLDKEPDWPSENWFDVFVPRFEVLVGQLVFSGWVFWGLEDGKQRRGPFCGFIGIKTLPTIYEFRLNFLDMAKPSGNSLDDPNKKIAVSDFKYVFSSLR